jgi:hypothetical protein
VFNRILSRACRDYVAGRYPVADKLKSLPDVILSV